MPVTRFFGHRQHLFLQQVTPVCAVGASHHQHHSRPLPKYLIPVRRRELSFSTPTPTSPTSTPTTPTPTLPPSSLISTSTSTPARSRLVRVCNRIRLTELEERIFSTLKDVLRYFRLNTQLRIAGGWVRDKLLGEESDDIDIALDDMLGKAFCQKLVWYLRNTGIEANGFGVIKSNPLQAKHLEVARMQIFGVYIDFVNLRPDHYAKRFSFPAMQDFGTATEDAFRRDLTINSLFYNINTGIVEDPTGKGLLDLRAGILATPLPAKRTFMDDPLRVLRAIRFVATLDYELHRDIKAAVDKDIRLALSSKISRERIGREVERIFRSEQPIKALKQLVELELFPIIFSPPLEFGMELPEGIDRLCLLALEAVWEVLNVYGMQKLMVEDRKICLLAAFLFPLRAVQHQHQNKMIPISLVIIKESLKMRAVDATKVATLHETAQDFNVMRKQLIDLDSNSAKGRDTLADVSLESTKSSSFALSTRLLLQSMKGLWRPALLLSSILEEPIISDNMTSERRSAEFVRRSNLCAYVEEAILRLGPD